MLKNNIKVAECYICKSNKIKFYKNVNGFVINKCFKCGLLWVKEINKNVIFSFYNQKYFNNGKKMGYKNYLVDEKNHRKNAQNIFRIVDKIKDLTKLKILDIGCAFGFLLDEARRLKECEAYGIELSEFAYQYASKRLGLKVSNCDFDELNFEPNFFDAVFLVGTIEHLVFPKETLGHINQILKPQGLLVVTTIDTKGLIPLYSLKPPEHLFYFNHKNLSLLLEESGFKCLVKKGYFVNYHLHDLLYRLGEFLSFSFLSHISKLFEKFNISMKIPTNEMIVIAEKVIL